MSLLSSTSSIVGSFTHLQTETLNGPRLLNFGGGADGDVLTYHPVSVDFNMNDLYYATLQTIGNPGNSTFTATLAFY